MSEHNELIDAIAEKARILQIGRPLPSEGELSEPQLEGVREDLNRLLAERGVTAKRISEAMGGDLSDYLIQHFADAMTDARQDQRIGRQVNRFLEAFARRETVRKPDGFIETKIALRIVTLCKTAGEMNTIAMIVGGAGMGKSVALEAARGLIPGAMLITATRNARTPATVLRMLADVSGSNRSSSKQGSYWIERRLIEQWKGQRRTILVDEAHNLSADAFDTLRGLHDLAGVAVVLSGTAKVREAIADSDVFSGQFTSRVSMILDLDEPAGGKGGNAPPPFSPDEIRALFERGHVRLTGDAAELLSRIANAPGLGSLRRCSRLIQLAIALQGGRAGELVTLDRKTLLRAMRGSLGREESARLERAAARAIVAAA